MGDHDDFDEDYSRRAEPAPYTAGHRIPNISRYREREEHRRELEQVPDNDHAQHEEGAMDKMKSLLHIDRSSHDTPEQKGEKKPYEGYNRNVEEPASNDEREQSGQPDGTQASSKNDTGDNKNSQQKISGDMDPKQKRKMMKHMERDDAGREVTDPVTHLPIIIHDSTEKELKNIPENFPPSGSDPRTASGFSAASKSESQLHSDQQESQEGYDGMRKLFPPPNFEDTKEQLNKLYSLTVIVGLSAMLLASLTTMLVNHLIRPSGPRSWLSLLITSSIVSIVGLTLGGGILYGLRGYLANKIDEIWDDEIWTAARIQERQQVESPTPESAQWLNSLLSSIWPLINPDLFTSLADTLEDVMQASLPKMVRMISVEDLGQGSEALRILGIRWLPTGAAAKSVSVDGKVKSSNRKENSDRTVPSAGEVDDDAKSDASEQPEKDDKGQEGDNENIAEGMEAEEGDFVNVEVAFSYRASSSGKELKKKVKNAHLYLAFYLPGRIRFPVWVELRGIVGTVRLRLQLCPDPPFFSLCTMTLLGQPKANMSCIPLAKHFLNVMDLPVISAFVQSSIDAALSEYVAPKSITLDLKDMLVGDDFKKDTNARGVLVVRIKSAQGFKEGDGAIAFVKKGSSDPYVSVGWAKYGKPVWSTRVIEDEMEPAWDETAFVLVGPNELNAEERLRVQLWDSDTTSADDDLGRVEVDLKELMHSPESNGKMWDRQDGFLDMDANQSLPGQLEWSVGYFAKVEMQEDQFQQQKAEPNVKTLQQLKDKVSESANKKLREATDRDNSDEIAQQKAQDLKTREDNMIISAPPPAAYPTGMLSVQIHNITGLQFEQINKNSSKDDEGDNTGEGHDDLPSSYCTIILNHQAIFRSRTKPKNNKPFFNAGTERMIRDWRNTEVMIAVQDSRVHEDDALMGMIYLNLGHLFRQRCQLMDSYPLVGGIGYGRVRISMVFRSIKLQAPKELLGWDYGTIEITGAITSEDLSDDLRGLRIKLHSSINRVKMYSSGNDGTWTAKKDHGIRIAIRKRYRSCLVIEFRKNNLTINSTPAFAILWLKDIPDNEEKTVKLDVWHGDKAKLNRSQNNCLDVMGEKAGSINVPLKFLPGLSGSHKRLASKNPNLKTIFDVLETASDNKEIRDSMEVDGDPSSDSSSDDDGGSDSSGGVNHHSDEHNQDSGSRGPIDQIMDYKDHHKQLHRKHRGVMQFKTARTGNWMKTKLDHGKEHIMDKFKHHERDPGIETEV